MGLSQSFFAAKFGITERDLEAYLSEALSAGGEYADLYFEYLATSSIGIDEGIVKSATEGVTLGVGVRVLVGERTGYAYSDDLDPGKIRKAARVAALIARGPTRRPEPMTRGSSRCKPPMPTASATSWWPPAKAG
jgi:TldD protein